MCVHTHMHTHAHTRALSHTHALTQARTHRRAHTGTCTPTHLCMHTHTRTHAHSQNLLDEAGEEGTLAFPDLWETLCLQTAALNEMVAETAPLPRALCISYLPASIIATGGPVEWQWASRGGPAAPLCHRGGWHPCLTGAWLTEREWQPRHLCGCRGSGGHVLGAPPPGRGLEFLLQGRWSLSLSPECSSRPVLARPPPHPLYSGGAHGGGSSVWWPGAGEGGGAGRPVPLTLRPLTRALGRPRGGLCRKSFSLQELRPPGGLREDSQQQAVGD